MKNNMGVVDRVLRMVVAAVIAALLLTGRLGGTVGIVLGVVAVIFLATSAAGVCPLYSIFGFSTKPRAEGEQGPSRIDV
jgi:hypothetical protein